MPEEERHTALTRSEACTPQQQHAMPKELPHLCPAHGEALATTSSATSSKTTLIRRPRLRRNSAQRTSVVKQTAIHGSWSVRLTSLRPRRQAAHGKTLHSRDHHYHPDRQPRAHLPVARYFQQPSDVPAALHLTQLHPTVALPSQIPALPARDPAAPEAST